MHTWKVFLENGWVNVEAEYSAVVDGGLWLTGDKITPDGRCEDIVAIFPQGHWTAVQRERVEA